MTWREVTLGDHVDLVTGFPFKSAEYEGETPKASRLLRGDNIAQGMLRWDGARYWPASKAGDHAAMQLQAGDVVLAMDRPWIAAGLKWATVTAGDLPALLVQRVARLRAKDALLQSYLPYVIASSAFTDHVQAITTGVNVPHISGRDIRAFRFRLPSPDEQRRIAFILSAYDDLIEVNRRRVAILEDMARRLFEEWFVHLRFPGHAAVPVHDTLGGPVPEGWQKSCAGDLVAFDPPTPAADADSRFVPMAALTTDTASITFYEERAGRSGARFLAGDTLFARITPCMENGKTALVPTLDSDSPVGVGSTEFIVMRPKLAGVAYTYCLARLSGFRSHARASMSGATGRQRVRVEHLRGYGLVQPPAELLAKFENLMTPVLDQGETLNRANTRLAAARDLLLPRLLSRQHLHAQDQALMLLAAE